MRARRTTHVSQPALASVSSPALGQLNPALNSFAGTQGADEKSQQEAAAENKIGGMTFDEAQKGVEEGSI
jgi:hypothetical protein